MKYIQTSKMLTLVKVYPLALCFKCERMSTVFMLDKGSSKKEEISSSTQVEIDAS